VTNIRSLSEEEAKPLLPQLIELLQDAIISGASVGFVEPLTLAAAQQFWLDNLAELGEGKRILLVSSEDDTVTGSVQLALATKPNALHRAEVQKLLVHTNFRNRGIGRSLMNAVEEAARGSGRSLLVLDTLEGSTAEGLYARWGYTRVGAIPQFAVHTDGTLQSTVVFYRLL